jgi:phosphoglycerate kinase
MKNITQLKNISGKKILLRLDLNVPIKDNKIIDDFRIRKSLKTILFLQKNGAKVIIISHLGDEGSSLSIVAKRLQRLVKNFKFIKTPILSSETRGSIDSMASKDVVLLENLRNEKGEKENSVSFARGLSRYADIYVNDAFSVSHRKHASVSAIGKYLDSYAGFQMVEEVSNLSKSFSPKRPFTFILGGAKFETKIPLINKFIKKADYVFIGGAIANNFIKEKGCGIGKSIFDDGDFGIKKLLNNKKVIIPSDVVVTSLKGKRISKIEDIKEDETIVDIGPESEKTLEELINKSKYILWNGPLGKYEVGFSGSTLKILKSLARAKAFSVVGGGDTVSLISKLKIEDKLGFVSTGGGATLEFLSKGDLPGIRILK